MLPFGKPCQPKIDDTYPEIQHHVIKIDKPYPQTPVNSLGQKSVNNRAKHYKYGISQ